MTAYKRLVVLAAAAVLGFSTQAAAQKCSATGESVECNGTIFFNGGGAVLLKVTAKELGTPDFGRDISVRVCAPRTVFDFIAVVARTAAPKDVVRCDAVDGATCVAHPVQKSPTASSDSVLVTLMKVDLIASGTGKFQIRRSGWDEMKVEVLDTSKATVAFPQGAVACP